ncbi:MAG: 3'-5' exonuclease, partial [Actinocatenispora sp.]
DTNGTDATGTDTNGTDATGTDTNGSDATGTAATGAGGGPDGATVPDDRVAEERRLLFVGITRAQDRLYLSHAARRMRRGAERPQPVAESPFLTAIDPRLYDRLGDDPTPRRPQARQLRLL